MQRSFYYFAVTQPICFQYICNVHFLQDFYFAFVPNDVQFNRRIYLIAKCNLEQAFHLSLEISRRERDCDTRSMSSNTTTRFFMGLWTYIYISGCPYLFLQMEVGATPFVTRIPIFFRLLQPCRQILVEGIPFRVHMRSRRAAELFHNKWFLQVPLQIDVANVQRFHYQRFCCSFRNTQVNGLRSAKPEGQVSKSRCLEPSFLWRPTQ